MSTPTISVIVPVYNVEKYLRRCIDSVLVQTFTDFELLLIDDGSKDKSGVICDRYALKDGRIKIVHKVNTGVSDTRNTALNIAKGDYVLFLDSDDFLFDDSAIEKLLTTAVKYNLDIVRGEYKAVDSSGKDLFIHDIDRDKQCYMKRILDASTFLDKIIHREFFLPLCLIKTSALNDIRFNAKRVFLEDIEFFLILLLKPIKCMYIPLRFYAYRKHEQSASNRFSIERLRDAFDMSRLYFQLADNPLSENMKNSFVIRGIDYYRLTLQTMALNNKYYINGRFLCEELHIEALSKMVLRHALSLIKEGRFECLFAPLCIIKYYRIRDYLGKKKNSVKLKKRKQ